ncbi:DUF4247 domain-containing protein [Tumebacillus permanentifrigoris]|uniref:Uncharacterized protein DUF4247 n=1 Tax=Tumebacillus permanentifrigoris TaxID=378543 RepID=A0A316D9Y5_9BACL|nr:DUF4247 domain-containing protein [Tumebacillus permanentifrigoris]PWK13769.1 uncharacterized protein DUF4247 [Tumebacillus permanentifrigoris]
MKKSATKALAILLACSVMLVGCGGSNTQSTATSKSAQNVQDYLKDNYAFVSADGSGSTMQKVYRAEGQSVPAVAEDIADEQKPSEMSKQDDDDMFLVYQDQIVHVQTDAENPDDALVEVDTKQYVAQHYDPNYLTPFLAGMVIANMFGNDWKSKKYSSYHGYSQYKYSTKYPNQPYPNKSNGYSYPSSGGSSSGSTTTKPNTGSSSSGSTTTKPNTGSSSSGSTTTKPNTGSGSSVTPPKSSSGTGKVVPKSSKKK